MKKSTLILIILTAAAASFFAVVFVPHHPSGNAKSVVTQQLGTNSSALASQTNTDGTVQVSVQPGDLQSSEWTFAVSMNTHSGNLPQDLTQSVTLTDDKGNKIALLRWENGVPSSMPDHHKSGTFVFAAPASKPQSITLTISNISGVAIRTFSWNLP